jgi:hypothetical protein
MRGDAAKHAARSDHLAEARLSPLKFANGITAIEGLSGSGSSCGRETADN